MRALAMSTLKFLVDVLIRVIWLLVCLQELMISYLVAVVEC